MEPRSASSLEKGATPRNMVQQASRSRRKPQCGFLRDLLPISLAAPGDSSEVCGLSASAHSKQFLNPVQRRTLFTHLSEPHTNGNHAQTGLPNLADNFANHVQLRFCHPACQICKSHPNEILPPYLSNLQITSKRDFKPLSVGSVNHAQKLVLKARKPAPQADFPLYSIAPRPIGWAPCRWSGWRRSHDRRTRRRDTGSASGACRSGI